MKKRIKNFFICFMPLLVVSVFGLTLEATAVDFDRWNKWDDSVFDKFKYENFEKAHSHSQGYQSALFDNWLMYSSFDFDIYYYNDLVVRDVLDNIDRAYNLIINDLSGVFFYNPQNRVKIYIYRNRNAYRTKTSGGGWSGGYADVKKNAIYTYEQKDLMRDVMVHELTHLVFDSFMGWPRNRSINWLHEGLAVYEEKRFFNKKWDLKYLKRKDKQGKMYSLQKAFKTESGLEKSTKKISTWYLQMGTVVYFLFHLDKDGFKVFCENMKTYKNLDEALKYTYPWDFKTVAELNEKWRKWLYEQGDIL